MKIFASIAGAYPRIGVNYGYNLRELWHEYDRGKVLFTKIVEAQDSIVRLVVSEQINANMDLITDGLIRWYCPVSRFYTSCGVESGPLHHYYDTNLHVRVGIAHQLPAWTDSILAEEIKFVESLLLDNKKVLAVLPGLETLMLYTENRTDYPDASLRKSYEHCLTQERASLGVSVFYDDPNPFCSDFQIIKAIDATDGKEYDAKKIAKKIIGKINPQDVRPVLLIPNRRLDLLPHKYAKEKMLTLGKVKEELNVLLS